MVGELLEVALDVAWCEGGAAVGEDGVYAVPCEKGSVVAVGDVVGELALGETFAFGGRGELPVCGLYEAGLLFGVFELVDV